MSCWGVSGSCPPIQRLIDNGKAVPPTSHWCDPFIHELLFSDTIKTDDLNCISHLHQSQRLPMPRINFFSFFFPFPLSHDIKPDPPPPLVKSCCHSDSLTGWEERWLSLDVVNVSWPSEWGNAGTYDSVHYSRRSTFPGTWRRKHISQGFCCHCWWWWWSKCSWLEHILQLGSLAERGEKHLTKQIFIMWLFLLIYASDTRRASRFLC